MVPKRRKPMAENRHIIALDVGGSSVKSGVVEVAAMVVSDFDIAPIDSQGSADEIIGTLATVVTDHLEVFPNAIGIGIGFPGPTDYEAGIIYIQGVEKYESIYGMNVHDALKVKLDRDIRIRFRNDAEASIVGEGVYGVGKGYSRLIGLTLGTGCGSAFLIDGVPQTAGKGVPDNGWVYPIRFDGEQADDVFSTRGLLKRLHDADIQTGSVADAVQQADETEVIRDVLRQFGDDLGQFIKPIADEFEADLLVLQGGIAQGFDYFGEDVKKHLAIPVHVGKLERDAPLLGVANMFVD